MFCQQCGARNSDQAHFCTVCGQPLTTLSEQLATRQTVNYVATPIIYAGFWLRFFAATIDGILSQMLAFFIILPMSIMNSVSEVNDSAMMFDFFVANQGMGTGLGILIQWLWFTIAESSSWQATVGKKLLGLKVTDEQGNRIDFLKANIRYWSKILSALFLCIGYIMVAFTERKQGLHDKLAATLVIKDNS